MSEQPSTPTRDEQDNTDFGPTEEIGEGYPEEQPAGADEEGEPREGRPEQPERAHGGG